MSDSMRVAHLINSYLPRVGGAERQLAALAPLLQATGIDLHILARRYPGMEKYEQLDGVPVHRLRARGRKAMASLEYTAMGVRQLRALRPALLHAHEMYSAATTAVVARRLMDVPVVVTPHRSGPLGDVQRLEGKTLGRQRLAFLIRNVDAWVTISREIEEELLLQGVPPERCVRIPNGVDVTRFRPLPPEEKRALRASLAISEGPVALFAGRLAREKRVNHLIDIWHMVRALHPSALLLILGTGEQEGALRQAAGEGVRFAGQIEDVAPYFQASDLFILPSAAEGLSVAMLEAMATGLPVIATDVGGATDVVENGENGCLVPPDDIAALQGAVLALLADPSRRAAMGDNARARVETEYALPAMAARLARLYRQVREQYRR